GVVTRATEGGPLFCASHSTCRAIANSLGREWLRAGAFGEDEGMSHQHRILSRRVILASVTVGMSGLILAPDDAFAGKGLTATPSCDDGDEPTLPETEGPYFKPKSPHRSDLREKGLPGRAVELSGLVLTRTCKPVANAFVDLWHADSEG